MAVYNYELSPVKTKDRAERNTKTVAGTLVAKSYGSATQLASAKAAELSKERGEEYGVARIW